MTLEAKKDLSLKIQLYSHAYIRNLAVAEIAVQAGQFNAAKVLRAAAHSQRVLAMNAARLLTPISDVDPEKTFEAILHELDHGKGQQVTSPGSSSLLQENEARLDQFQTVESQLRDILTRATASLKDHHDVRESDVAQSIWGCFSCGYLIEGDLPDACPICGALSVEFDWFGPFYSSTLEHLGQRTPIEIITTLEKIPALVEELAGSVSEDLTGKKPSEEEWSIKEIIGHILEVERLFLKRVTTIMETQGIPELPSAGPPWKLHEGKGYENLKISELVSQLKETRSETIHFLSGLENDDWTRIGSNQGSTVSLLDLGTWLTNHDVGHVAQIKRYIP